MNSLGRIIAIFLAIFLIIIFPLQYIAQMQTETMDHIAEAHTRDFTDTIRKEACVTRESYEEYLDKLYQTGELYKIEIEHAAAKTAGELISENTKPGTLLVSNDTARLLSPDRLITPFAAHTHTDACYDGHRHIESGCYYRSGHSHSSSCYHSHSSFCYTKEYYQYTCDGCVTKTTYCSGCDTKTIYCSGCESDAPNDPENAEYWCPGHGTMVYCPGHTSKSCPGHWGYTSKRTCGKSTSTLICGQSSGPGGWSCGKTQDTSAICNTVAMSITATNPSQIVYTGDPIITTATATYLDGHTGTVNCTATGYHSTTPGIQTVTLTYSGKVGNAKTIGTRTGTITVTVKGRLQSISVTPSSTSVYNGIEPTYTIKAIYGDGTQKTLTSSQYTKAGWSSGPGKKIVTFQYTEFGKTVTKSVTITVLPNLIGVSITPSTQTIERYQNPSFRVMVSYEDGTSKTTNSFIIKNFNNRTLGTQTAVITYTENGITKTASVNVVVTNMTKTCPVCGTSYELDENDIDRGCPACSGTITGITVEPDDIAVKKGDALPITVMAVYQNGARAVITDWTSNYDPMKIGFQYVTVTYDNYKAYLTVEVKENVMVCRVCSNTYLLNPDGSDPGCPYCRDTVVKIIAEPNPIVTKMHQPLNLTVTAVYRDGHTEIVTGWTTNFIPDRAGIFEVTVYYKMVSCNISVTVQGDDINTCPYCGLAYRRSEHQNGCPACYVTIIGINARLRNGSTKVIKGSEPDLEIEVTFRDTHKEAAYTGYTISNYRPNIPGEQTITVHYQGHSTNLVIEIIDNLAKTICPNNHEYYLNEDKSDPGCPYCNNNIYKNNAVIYYDIIYTNDIVAALYEQGVYQMKSGDYITVIVTKRKKSIYSGINKLFHKNKGEKESITYGGEINGTSL